MREYTVIVVGVRVDGDLVATLPTRVRADRITYDVVPVDTSAIFADGSLDDVEPVNRPSKRTGIWSANVGDKMNLVQFSDRLPGGVRQDLYQCGTERPDEYLCNGEPVEP